MTVIDKFFLNLDSHHVKELKRISAIALTVVPDAEETISYKMPTLRYKGIAFLGFNIHSRHIGIYPFGGEEIEEFKKDIEKLNYGYSAGAIRVPFNSPIPKELLIRIIEQRISRI